MSEQVDIAQQRCFNHPGREAVARCLECARFFCRECVTEHEDRVVCAACLKKLVARQQRRRAPLQRLGAGGRFLFGFLVVWLFFYYMGRGLLLLPDAFHEVSSADRTSHTEP